ncbi:CHAT domain-containing protein [Laspinema olomoucense]|uniref:CHAT domain-containing protein n=1 Tax=Laspinema olomoucense TaxID=3231600 RepID=UPI0021BB9760|nr:CHAT domain-containing protein [Laspinema sp. D3d]MCT7972646.1 CHAT domain-containing protein [Laspinema sp. D3d]
MNKMWVLFVTLLSIPGIETGKCLAQAIAPAGDGTGTLVTPEGNRFEITGGQRSPDGINLFHSFERFNLDAGQIANFQSLPEIQNILGRITGGNASYINGLIQISGGPSNLFLMNPAGILFGPNAQLNLPGDLTVTTATGIGFGNHWFNATGDNNWANLVGTPSQFAFNLTEPGAIANLGHLNLADGQHLSLIGGTVLNAGALESRGGQITIAAVPGESIVRISQPNHLLSLDIAATPPEAGQSGIFPSEITPMSLPELLTGGGFSHANQVEVQGDGRITLSGSNINRPVELVGDAIASGTLEVSGEMGGEVTIVGERVAVVDATINANGTSGGGDIRIGGEFQGEGTIPNARRTFVSSSSAISADSLVQGDGGRIIVWADETTRFYGQITAQGGLQGGNGGFAEVSGKQYLDFAGRVNLSSPLGDLGTLLLDPINITVVPGLNNPAELTANNEFADPGVNNTINNETISAATAQVVLEASNDITFNAPIEIIFPGVGITARANNNIRVNQNITTNGGPVSFFALGNLKIVNATIATNGGDFTGQGTGNIGLTQVGVDLFNAAILAGGGNIELTGIGGIDTTNNYGVQLRNGSRLETTGTGEIRVTGTGGSGLEGGQIAIEIQASTLEIMGSGEIILQGTGGNSTGPGITTASNNGINIGTNSVVRSGSGDIRLSGTGGSGDYGSHLGINISSGTRVETGGTGRVEFSAIAGNSTSDGDNFGLLLKGPNTLVSTADGNIEFTATGGNSGGMFVSNVGMALQNEAMIQTTGTGNITLTGTGGVGNSYNEGISISNSPTIQALGTGSITLNGTGGPGISNNFGITASGTGPIFRSGDGDILIRGIGAATGVLNSGMSFSNARIETTGTGEISLVGEGTIEGEGLTLVNSIVTANGGGTVRLQGDEINLTGTTAIAGTGILYVEPFSPTIPITLGGGISWSPLQLNLESTDIAAIKDGFDRVFIGSQTGSNAITLQGDAIFNSSVTIQAPGAGGSIAYTGGTLSGANNSAIALVADGDVAASNITTPGGNIEITSNNGNITTVAGTTLNTSTPTGDGGAIAISAPGNIAVSNLNTATTDGASTSQAGPITLSSGMGMITLNGNIDTSATAGSGSAIAFAGDVTLTQPTTTLTTSGTASGGEITFKRTLNGTIPGTQSLTLNAGSGNLSILGPVGNLTPLGAFTLNSTGTTLLNSAIAAQTLTTDAGGITQLNRNVTTTGAIAFGDAVSLGNSVILTSGGNPVTFGSTLDGTHSLILNGGMGNITFLGAVGSQTELGAFTVNSTGTTQFGSSVNSASLITNAGGVTQINGNVTTTSPLGQIYGNALSINGDVILTGDGIEFQQAVSGTGSLTLAPYTLTQAITIGGTNASGVGNLDLTAGELSLLQPGFTHLTIGGRNTSGLISLTGNLELSIPLTLQALGSGGAINTTGGTLTGNSAAAIALQADGTIQTGNILNSSGTITLTSNTGNLDTSAGTLDTSSPTASGGAITLNSPTGNITLGGINSSTTAADSTTTAGTVTLNAVSGEITLYNDINSSATTGSGLDIIFTGDVTLAQSVLLNAGGSTASGNIRFDQSVNSTTGSESLTAVAGSGNVTFSAAVGDINPIGDLTVNSTGMTQFGGTVNAQTLTLDAGGTSTIAGNITTTGGQSYGDAVSILGNLTFTGDEIDFYNPVSGTGDLILQPFTPSLAIALGGGFDTGATTLDLTATDVGWLQNGFNSLTIGRANSSGAIALSGNVTFADPVTVRSPLNPGSITTTGFTLSGTDNATLTLQSSGNITTGPIATPGNSITLNSTTGAIDTTGGTLNTTAATNGGPITLTAAQTLSTGDILTYSTATGNGGLISLNTPSAIATGSLDASAVSGIGGTILLNGSTLTPGNITTTNNNINLNAPVTLATDATIQITGNGGAITFNSTLDGDRNLTLNAGKGPITFQGAIGSLNPLQNLTVITTGATAITEQITVNNTLDFTAATGGTQLTTDAAITANTGNILLQNSPISGANHRLTLSAPTGTISLDAIGSNGNELGALAIESAAILNLFGNIYTNGGIDFTQANTINLPGTGIILETDSDNGSLTTTGVSVNGPGSLTVNAGTGNVEFGTLGNSSALAGITVNAATVNATSPITVGTGGMTINASGAISTGSPITATGAVNFTANTDITTQAITGTEINLTSNTGAIATGNSITATGSVNFTANTDITTQAITGTDITLTSNTGAIAIGNEMTASGAVAINSDKDITTQAITGTEINLTSNNGAIAIGNGISASGAVAVNSDTNITTQAITGTEINLTSNNGAIAIGNEMTASGAVAINFDKDITTQAITGTDITLTSNTGAIATQGPITAAGTLNFTAPNDVTTQDIRATNINITSTNGNLNLGNLNTASTTAAGGYIFLTSNTGAIASGHLTSSGATDGGEIFVNASTQITAGEINSSGTSGVGGNVTLDPSGDIQVTWINSEGATQGGFVDITTGRFFRATGLFTNRQGNSASISSLGGNGGSITIRHGGNGITPFIIGDGTNNGTAAQITTGSSAIASGSFLYTFTQGNIGIISVPEPPPPEEVPAPVETPPATPAPVETPPATPAPVETPPATPTPAPRGIVVPVNPVLPEELPPQTAQPAQGLPLNVPTSPLVPQETAPIAQLSTESSVSQPQKPGQPQLSQPGQVQQFEPQSPESMAIAILEDATGNSLSPDIPIVALETRSPLNLSLESTTESTTQSAIVNFLEDYRKNPLSPLENPGFYPSEQILSLETNLDVQFSLTYHELGRERTNNEYNSLNSDSTIARLDTQYSQIYRGFSPTEAPTSNGVQRLTGTSSNPYSAAAISAARERIFEENNPEASIWTIEQLRNQEFEQYLGVTANLDQSSIALKYFQEVLQTIERQTGKQAAIIYAIARESQLELILVPPFGNPIRYSVPEAPRETLLAQGNELRQALTDPKQRHNTRYLRSAQQLHEWLIAPMKQDLQKLGISTLMFSLDPGLRSIPLAAFHDGEKFLIETYSYSLIPSFSLTNHLYENLENSQVLAMGASEFTEHKALPGVPLELEAIASEIWPGKSFLNQQFTRENLLQQREFASFSIIHLATHAEFLPGNASNSYIQLWENQLHLDEIPTFNWDNPKVELLVLSACRTALGDEEAELGFGGLAVQAGVKTAVASLWYVSDEGTLGLMTDFYHHLRTSPLKAEALRQAQINMIHNKIRIENGQLLNAPGTVQLPPELSHLSNLTLSHPYYWSGFTAIGSPW